ncbi:MAG: glycosyltransferase domain-containing protein, partial [Pseudanabaena sp.]
MQTSKEIVFITLCDANSPLVQPLYSSLRGDLRIIETYSASLGLLSKIFKVREFLADDTEIADNSIIVFTDAYDVLCIRYDPNGLVTDFKNTGKDLIIGAETIFCHHSADILPFLLDNYSGQKAKYLNSGFIIGYKWAYLRMLNYIV